jgi:hypothetical protein
MDVEPGRGMGPGASQGRFDGINRNDETVEVDVIVEDGKKSILPDEGLKPGIIFF